MWSAVSEADGLGEGEYEAVYEWVAGAEPP